MSASITGIEQIMRNLERLTPEIEKNVGAALEKGGHMVEGSAKEYVRVKTGFLRGSIASVVIDWYYVIVGTACEYAIPQEFGTWCMEAQPYLTPAFEEHKQTVIQMAADAFEISCEAICV